MQSPYLSLVYFFYGLAFFSMGLAIMLELAHGTDQRLRHAFRPLQYTVPILWGSIDLILLTFSFLSLAAFGVFLITKSPQAQRYSMLVPLAMIAIWGVGMLVIRNRFPLEQDLLHVSHAWTRYSLAVPASLLACVGLIFQQREFRLAGMARFGRDSLWAAIAFLWYGLAGQTFPSESPLPPSNVINQDLFYLFFDVFGFPVQLLRASTAVFAAVFIIRVLRSFEVETRRRIADLQAARLEEAQRREALRGEMLRQIVAAQEAERQRIARELHDETGQALTALGLGLRGVASSIENKVDKAYANIKQLQRLVDRSLLELQRLITDLRPSHLDDLGLGATLRWYGGEIENRLPLEVKVSVRDEKADLSTEMKTTMFRITQEALTNVIKHAAANQAKVTLTYQEKGVHLEIVDDGVGFNQTAMQMSSRQTWGLLGMQERTTLLGGTFEIISIPETGTRVEVYIPYNGQTKGTQDENSPVVS
jgi:signal transduction histidine kinase